MKNLKLKIARWLLRSIGYNFIAIKNNNAEIWIDGDVHFIRQFDIHKILNSPNLKN